MEPTAKELELYATLENVKLWLAYGETTKARDVLYNVVKNNSELHRDFVDEWALS